MTNQTPLRADASAPIVADHALKRDAVTAAVPGIGRAAKQVPVVLPRSLYRTISLPYWLAALVLGGVAWVAILRLF